MYIKLKQGKALVKMIFYKNEFLWFNLLTYYCLMKYIKSVCFNSILLLKIDLNQKLFRVGKTNFRHFSHQILWLDRN